MFTLIYFWFNDFRRIKFLVDGALNDFDAQDLMQEVYLMAWEKLPQFAGGNFTAWLRTIAHHTFVNRLRKYRLELLTEELPDMPPEDELLGPVHITEQRALRRLLLQTIDSGLSPVQSSHPYGMLFTYWLFACLRSRSIQMTR